MAEVYRWSFTRGIRGLGGNETACTSLRGLSVEDDSAVTQCDRAVCGIDERKFMCGNDERRSDPMALVEQFEKSFASFGIETDEWLIDEEQVEWADQSESNRRFLTKTSTESGR
jgi:hypothetical protein